MSKKVTLREKVRVTARAFQKANASLIDVEQSINFQGFPSWDLPVANYAPGGEFFLEWHFKELDVDTAVRLMETVGHVTPKDFT